MKANLIFNLNDEDDKLNFELATKAMDMHLAIDDVQNILRKHYKYPIENISAQETIELIRDEITNVFLERGVLG